MDLTWRRACLIAPAIIDKAIVKVTRMTVHIQVISRIARAVTITRPIVVANMTTSTV